MGEIYREFPYYCNKKLAGHYGNIDMWISDNNCLYIIINGFYENMVQITMSVKYVGNLRFPDVPSLLWPRLRRGTEGFLRRGTNISTKHHY
jgi:hypothetical protein